LPDTWQTQKSRQARMRWRQILVSITLRRKPKRPPSGKHTRQFDMENGFAVS
jgi:hypothetical protein